MSISSPEGRRTFYLPLHSASEDRKRGIAVRVGEDNTRPPPWGVRAGQRSTHHVYLCLLLEGGVRLLVSIGPEIVCYRSVSGGRKKYMEEGG